VADGRWLQKVFFGRFGDSPILKCRFDRKDNDNLKRDYKNKYVIKSWDCEPFFLEGFIGSSKPMNFVLLWRRGLKCYFV
jgi:hypothetical protein